MGVLNGIRSNRIHAFLQVQGEAVLGEVVGCIRIAAITLLTMFGKEAVRFALGIVILLLGTAGTQLDQE